MDQDGIARERVQELARQLTRQSSRHHESASVHGAAAGSESGDFLIEKGSELDPFSDNFNAKAWTRKIVGVTSRDPVNHPKRTAGVAFKNLRVHGFGSDSGFQQTVGNAPVAGFGTIKDLVGGKKQKIDILKGFDGLLDAGDMLVVLGPPGRWVFDAFRRGSLCGASGTEARLVALIVVVRRCSRPLPERLTDCMSMTSHTSTIKVSPSVAVVIVSRSGPS